jgi:hypothetical protein
MDMEPAKLLEELERCQRLLRATDDPAVIATLNERIDELREALDRLGAREG